MTSESKPARRPRLHLPLQVKGGVGKSYVASIVAQYLQDTGNPIISFDVDPGNPTFSQYKGIRATWVDIIKGDQINARTFDGVMGDIMEFDGDAVVDVGSPTFIPLSAYMVQNKIVDLFDESGRDVVFHVVIAGGSNMADTIAGFIKTAESARPKSIVLWINEFFGDVLVQGKPFIESKYFDAHMGKVMGVIQMADLEKSTFGKDIEEMCARRLCFRDLPSSSMSLFSKSRLRSVKLDFYGQLQSIGI